jgi:hypothetical protein
MDKKDMPNPDLAESKEPPKGWFGELAKSFRSGISEKMSDVQRIGKIATLVKFNDYLRFSLTGEMSDKRRDEVHKTMAANEAMIAKLESAAGVNKESLRVEFNAMDLQEGLYSFEEKLTMLRRLRSEIQQLRSRSKQLEEENWMQKAVIEDIKFQIRAIRQSDPDRLLNL